MTRKDKALFSFLESPYRASAIFQRGVYLLLARPSPRDILLRFILGSEALELGLVDGYGTIFDAGRIVYELANEPLKEGEVPNLFIKDDKSERIMKILESGSLISRIVSGLFPALR